MTTSIKNINDFLKYWNRDCETNMYPIMAKEIGTGFVLKWFLNKDDFDFIAKEIKYQFVDDQNKMLLSNGNDNIELELKDIRNELKGEKRNVETIQIKEKISPTRAITEGTIMFCISTSLFLINFISHKQIDITNLVLYLFCTGIVTLIVEYYIVRNRMMKQALEKLKPTWNTWIQQKKIPNMLIQKNKVVGDYIEITLTNNLYVEIPFKYMNAYTRELQNDFSIKKTDNKRMTGADFLKACKVSINSYFEGLK